jgi:hypothetical protein
MGGTYIIYDFLVTLIGCPLIVFATLLFAVFSARKGNSTNGAVASAILMAVYGLIVVYTDNRVLDKFSTPFFMGFFTAGIYYDQFLSESDEKLRLRLERSIGLMILATLIWCGLNWKNLESDRIELVFSAKSLTVKKFGHSFTQQQKNMRIIEYDYGTSRQWHIKDGIEIISMGDGDVFSSPDGKTISAFELVGRIEKWLGKPREHKQPPIYDGGTFLRQP